MKNIYYNKWFPRLFYVKPDGGKDSGVTAYFLIEWKILFSIGILKFNEGSREAYHTHAFAAFTWWLKGWVTEHKVNASFNSESRKVFVRRDDILKDFKPSFIPKYTSMSNLHKVIAHKTTWALTFRGPWLDFWYEFKEERLIKLTHGRKLI